MVKRVKADVSVFIRDDEGASMCVCVCVFFVFFPFLLFKVVGSEALGL